VKTIAFFNSKGGVGGTALVYHLAWMLSDMGFSILAVDLDPQANLSAMFLDEDRLEEFWPVAASEETLLGPVRPLFEGKGGIGEPYVERIDDVGLLVGDLALSGFEDELSRQWPRCLDGDERAFRVIGAFHEIVRKAVVAREAELALIDVGPNLGAVNRAALIASQRVVVPLGPDPFSLKGLRDLGPALRGWRRGWAERLDRRPEDFDPPAGEMEPMGYVVVRHPIRLDRPVKAFEKWMSRIPGTYREALLGTEPEPNMSVGSDPHCLATLGSYGSLMLMAREARKPMFHLKPADGAIGSHVNAVSRCYWDFKRLAEKIAKSCGLAMPE